MVFKVFQVILSVCLIASALWGCGNGVNKSATNETVEDIAVYSRIISLNGAITESLFALGKGDKVVGVDVTSTFPEEVLKLANVGHITKLNAEGILSLQPDLILACDDFADQQLIEQLQQAGVKVIILPKPFSFDASKQLIDSVSILANAPNAGDSLIAFYNKDIQQLHTFLESKKDKAKGMFLYARGAGTMMVAGSGTQVNAMMRLAGAKNVFESEITQFKPLTTESLAQANPEFILMFSQGIASLEGIDGLLQVPGIALTEAGRNRHIIHMEGHYLSGFGPRAAQAALELAQKLYSQPKALHTD